MIQKNEQGESNLTFPEKSRGVWKNSEQKGTGKESPKEKLLENEATSKTHHDKENNGSEQSWTIVSHSGKGSPRKQSLEQDAKPEQRGEGIKDKDTSSPSRFNVLLKINEEEEDHEECEIKKEARNKEEEEISSSSDTGTQVVLVKPKGGASQKKKNGNRRQKTIQKKQNMAANTTTKKSSSRRN